MEILVVNPNTTASMTEKIGASARAAASPGTAITAVHPATGPESIEGFYDEALAVPGLLVEVAKGEARGVAGHVIACFDDTGLDAARALARAPVVGIGEAAFHLASLIAGSFSVVTTLERAVPAIRQNLVRYGLAARCARVRAADIPVLALEDPASDARKPSSSAARAWPTSRPICPSAAGCPWSTAWRPRWSWWRRSPPSASGPRSWAGTRRPWPRPSAGFRP
jgi:allantoin racemase